MTVRPLRRDAARNRELLLSAAAQVFAEQGLAASVDEIARVAGVGMGTLYRRFPTKQDLVDQLVRDVLERFAALADANRQLPGGLGLETFLRQASVLLADNRGCLPQLWTTPAEQALVRQAREHIEQMVADAQHHGRVRREVVGTDVTVALWSLRGIVQSTRSTSAAPWSRHLELLLAGLRPADVPLLEPPLSQEEFDVLRLEAPG